MLSIITSYLLQTERATLPYIGHFDRSYTPAINDYINKQILPPVEEIIFREETILSSPHLVKFIAAKKNITESDAAFHLDEFCKEWKEKLEAGETLCFESFGCLKKNEFDSMVFSIEDNQDSYYQPVDASRVLQPDAEHAILVGDVETTSGAMLDYYNEETGAVKNRSWLLWALALFVVSVIVLWYSFYDHKWSTGGIGNRSYFIAKTAGETYLKSEK